MDKDEVEIDICGSLQVDIGFTESSILLYYSSNSKVASKSGSDHICCIALPSLLSKATN